MRLKDKWFNDREFLLPFFNKLIGNEKDWKMPFMTTVPAYDITCQLDSGGWVTRLQRRCEKFLNAL
mgnify:CR=1 FL=1